MVMMEILSTMYDDEDFITLNLCFSSSSPPLLPNRRSTTTLITIDDFEFQITSSSLIQTSAADELFHHGKLLPLQNTPSLADQENDVVTTLRDVISSILAANTKTLADEQEDFCFFEWSNDVVRPDQNSGKLSENWPKRIYYKALNASKKCIKSLFTKPALIRNKLLLSAVKKDEVVVVKKKKSHRRSFSDDRIFTSSSSSNSSSSSSSSSSTPASNINEQDNAAFENLKKRSISSRFEVEKSIEGAIAYCKSSHAM